MEEGLFEFRRLTLRHDLLLSNLRKFCSSDESSVQEADGFREGKFSRSFFSPATTIALKTHDRIGSWLVSVFKVGHPNRQEVPRIINSNLPNSSGETSLPFYDQLQVKNNKESRWGQPEGLCRKEKWPRGHM